MGLSARAIASELGVSHTAVNKAATRGRIQREPDGTFNLETVRAAWDSNVDLRQQQRGVPAKTEPPPPAAAQGNGEPPEPPLPSGLALIQLRQAEIKLELDTLDLLERKGKLIESDQIDRHIEARAASEKQALLNWPSDVSAGLAAELGVEERLLRKALDDRICKFLAGRSRVAVPAE